MPSGLSMAIGAGIESWMGIEGRESPFTTTKIHVYESKDRETGRMRYPILANIISRDLPEKSTNIEKSNAPHHV